MAHFAELNDSNVVLRVIVISNEDVDANGGDYHADAEAFVKSKFGGHLWKQCSYNHKARKLFPGKGYTYDASKNKFLPPKPFSSWSLDENDDWQPPGKVFPTSDDGLLADDTKVFISDRRWDDDNTKWLGSYIPEQPGVARVAFEWNASTKKWDLV